LLPAHVEEIVPSIDPGSRTFIVKLGVGGPSVRSGLFGRARFRTGVRQALVIPFSAVREQGQMRSVFVVDNGVARSRLVTLGARFNAQIEVLSGLQAGERIVINLTAAIQDGAALEVRQ
jgi:membrane fusion protein, multidrug efflux system